MQLGKFEEQKRKIGINMGKIKSHICSFTSYLEIQLKF